MLITIIQSLVFITYVLFIIYRFGVLPSISESWYKLKPLNLGILFTFFCWGIGLPMVFRNTGISPFFFISGAAICFTGVATAFKLQYGIEKIVHAAGAIICVIAGLIALWVDYNLWLPSAVFLGGFLIIKSAKIKNEIWWIEIYSFVVILAGLIFSLFI